MSRDFRNYRAIYSRVVDLAEEWQALDFEPATDRDLATLTAINRCGSQLAALLVPDDDEPAEPKHEARQPSPLTMIGRK